MPYPVDEGVHSGAVFEIGEDVRPLSAHAFRVAIHHS